MYRFDDTTPDEGTRLLPLTGATLDRRTDEPLQRLLEEARSLLGVPTASVSLVLRRVVFFRAAVGLPERLERTRGLEREFSLCQFVVAHRAPFCVVDVEKDARLPEAVRKESGVRAYLGEPLRMGGFVVGSLAVCDVVPRPFSDEQRQQLSRLAAQVSARLEELATPRVPTAMLVRGVTPLFGELRNILAPLKSNTAEAHVTTDELADELAALQSPHVTALIAELREMLTDIESGVERLTGGLLGLERIFVRGQSGASLEEIVDAATLLVAHVSRSAGGVRWSEFAPHVRVRVPVGVAASAVSMCLSALAERAGRSGREGIDAVVVVERDEVRFELSTGDVELDVGPLNAALGNQPNVSLEVRGTVVSLTIARDHDAERVVLKS